MFYNFIYIVSRVITLQMLDIIFLTLGIKMEWKCILDISVKISVGFFKLNVSSNGQSQANPFKYFKYHFPFVEMMKCTKIEIILKKNCTKDNNLNSFADIFSIKHEKEQCVNRQVFRLFLQNNETTESSYYSHF